MDEIAEVPPFAVVTVMSTDPGREEPDSVVVGDVTVIEVPDELTVNMVVWVSPKLTYWVPLNPLPVIVTLVAPIAGPVFGETDFTTGEYVKSSSVEIVGDEVPAAFLTATITVPVPAGVEVVILVSLTTVNLEAAVEPKNTAVAPVNPLPVIVTCVPPPEFPLDGVIPEITGT